jgi:hypothetical protein
VATQNCITPNVQQTAHKPIRYTPHQVAVMAQFANDLSADFARKVNPGMNQPFLGSYLERLVADESPNILPPIQRALNLKPNRKGEFTWIPR